MTGATILVADDDRAIRTVLDQALTRQGYEVRTTGKVVTLWRWIEDGEGNLVITDVLMPDGNGLDLVPRIKKLRPEIKIILMSAQNTMMTAVRAAEHGVFEYLPKPFDLHELVRVVGRTLVEPMRTDAGQGLDPADSDGPPLIGRSPAMQEIYRTLGRIMGTDLTVLIVGESGTGKELVARALHTYGKRRNAPFVAINMAAIPRDLVESELFGHERGAFTGATSRGVGRFEQAQGGTLFLDEIGDMPSEAQTRLLHVLQDGEFTTVGGRTAIRADVRIIAATHRNLPTLINRGQFREDLFYRLNVLPIRLPPLRDHVEDIPELVRHFLAQAGAAGLGYKSVDNSAMERLARHAWPGNVRELENLMSRFAALYSDDTINVEIDENELKDARGGTGPAREASSDTLAGAVEGHLRRYFDAHDNGLPAAGVYDRILREVERPLISIALAATREIKSRPRTFSASIALRCVRKFACSTSRSCEG